MKKQITYTSILLAAVMLTGCGDNFAQSLDGSISNIFDTDAAVSAAEKADAAAEASCAEAPAAAEAPSDLNTLGGYAEEAEAAMEDGLSYSAAMASDGAAKAKTSDARKASAKKLTADAIDAPDVLPDEALTAARAETEPEPDIELPFDNGSQPFILTAGEWNDNENWGFFANIVHNGTIEFPSYGLDPVYRVAVTLANGGTPVQNQTVQLKGDDVLWTAKTDKNGNAYLFYDKAHAGSELTIETADAEPVTFNAPADASGQGGRSVPTLEYTIETGAASQKYSDTEVCFILDTTGSMGDEITYLQKDFSAIAEEVAADGMTFSVNFYRDEGDEYVTRCNPFTDDVKSLQKALNQEYADGGGDEPEAVAQILDAVLANGDWHENTNKISFLIFDAPPHNGTDEAAMIENAVAAAAEQGIHVVPVVASNAARETELFGRALAIMTNSNYVFLTDDSGVGESHLEPIIGPHDVELLHDIIVRNILEIAK